MLTVLRTIAMTVLIAVIIYKYEYINKSINIYIYIYIYIYHVGPPPRNSGTLGTGKDLSLVVTIGGWEPNPDYILNIGLNEDAPRKVWCCRLPSEESVVLVAKGIHRYTM